MMNKPESNLVPNPMPTSLDLDMSDLDLAKLASIEGTALHAIVQELREDADDAGQSKHHSHHSYNTHGTAAW
jgi:hypothetical protein